MVPLESIGAPGFAQQGGQLQEPALQRQSVRIHQSIVYSNCLGKSFSFLTCFKSCSLGLGSATLLSTMCKDESNHQGELQKPEDSV